MFQSTRPHGARPGAWDASAGASWFQSTRPHGARHFFLHPRGLDGFVSIHAPTRGATPICRHVDTECLDVSIHAPTRGATFAERVKEPCPLPFQSTRPHGARRKVCDELIESGTFQSTRPHGARRKSYAKAVQSQSFQSTRPHGARRPCTCRWSSQTISFNPRAHTGRDAAQTLSVFLHPCFNPRAHTGRDVLTGTPIITNLRVSIHAPTRGATNGAIVATRIGGVSIHAPTRGATRGNLFPGVEFIRFQSTRPHGARLRQWSWNRSRFRFQSTRPHGARPSRRWCRALPSWFQSTRPHGARQFKSNTLCRQ